MRVILLGPPGSGKGTQGELVEKKYGFPRISTGDLLRAAVAAETPLGLEAKAVMESGHLVSDDIVIEMIRERIFSPDCSRGYLLDGFPRTLNQAESLDRLDGDSPEVALDIRVNDASLIDRLSARRVCSCGTVFNLTLNPPIEEGKCDACSGTLLQRDDDKPEVIRERLRVYREKTQPLIAYYRKKNHYHAVDGESGITEVFDEISRILDRFLGLTGEKRAE